MTDIFSLFTLLEMGEQFSSAHRNVYSVRLEMLLQVVHFIFFVGIIWSQIIVYYSCLHIILICIYGHWIFLTISVMSLNIVISDLHTCENDVYKMACCVTFCSYLAYQDWCAHWGTWCPAGMTLPWKYMDHRVCVNLSETPWFFQDLLLLITMLYV